VPETKGVPLEEMAAIFGDPEDVVIYLREVHVDHTNNELVVEAHTDEEKTSVQKVEESHVHNQPQGPGKVEA